MLIGFGCSSTPSWPPGPLAANGTVKRPSSLDAVYVLQRKAAIYALFFRAFFTNYVPCDDRLYSWEWRCGPVGLLLKRTVFEGNPFPLSWSSSYRLPGRKASGSYVGRDMDFVKRAFTVIFIMTIASRLCRFDFGLNTFPKRRQMLASIASFSGGICYRGIADWRALRLSHRHDRQEAMVSTFAILLGADEAGSAAPLLFEIFTRFQPSRFSFYLLYMPCAAAMAALRRKGGAGATPR
jgi:ferrous iron transport protein B